MDLEVRPEWAILLHLPTDLPVGPTAADFYLVRDDAAAPMEEEMYDADVADPAGDSVGGWPEWGAGGAVPAYTGAVFGSWRHPEDAGVDDEAPGGVLSIRLSIVPVIPATTSVSL